MNPAIVQKFLPVPNHSPRKLNRGLTGRAWPKGVLGAALAGWMSVALKLQLRHHMAPAPHSADPVAPVFAVSLAVDSFFLTVASIWGLWAAWSTCSAPCDGGIQTRGRSCPALAPGNPGCHGPHSQTRDCNMQPCTGAGSPPILLGPHPASPWSFDLFPPLFTWH